MLDAVVIGAGAAGIGATRALVKAGRSVGLLEAGDRPGGRAHTVTVEGMALDLGCGWLHSADRNPMVAIAEALGFAVDRAPAAWGRQYRDLGFPPADRHDAEAAYAAWDQRLRDAPPRSDRAADALDPGNRWNAFIEARSGYINGVGLAGLSIADYLAYDDAASECNWRLPAGYGALFEALAAPLPVSYATPVEKIDLGGADVAIGTPAGTLRARTAIVAIPSDRLAAGAIRFAPALDDRLEAAARLPLGLADKLFLAMDDADAVIAGEGHLIGDPANAATGSYYLRPFGRPLIECFFGGEGAVAIEAEGAAGAAAFAIDQLAALLGSDMRRRLRLIAASDWGHARFIGGSYSHALPGQRAARGVLAAPVDDRLFFAGEATHPTDFSTAHGAWESGERAAVEVLAALA